jgi:DNA (cytosine-5)-methyltransferase 1
MRYLSVCSGIEAASVAWHHLGWEPIGFSEIEPFPAAVLAHRFPNILNFGDMTKYEQWPLQPGSIDLLVGGTPCQSFSVAGLRAGLSDPRGGLMLTYLEIARRLRPRWVVWENVPGVLSSNGGRDFGSFLGAMGLLGYGVAYRVLDAQWVRTHGHPRAVPQRRRRVFVVGCLGDWSRAAQVLFERESVQRNSAKSGTAREEIAGTLAARSGECRNNPEQLVAGTLGRAIAKSRTELDNHGAYIPMAIQAGAIRENPASGPDGVGVRTDGVAYTIEARAEVQAVGQPVPYDLFQITAPVNRQNRKPGDPCHTLARDNAAHAAVAFANRTRDGVKVPEVMADGVSPAMTNPGNGGRSDAINVAIGLTTYETPKFAHEVQPTLTVPSPSGGGQPPAVAHAMTVRRLTPVECERLQGFPDNWTLIPWRKKPAEECPDGPRYKALGNSMACNCMAWIGERIAKWEADHA